MNELLAGEREILATGEYAPDKYAAGQPVPTVREAAAAELAAKFAAGKGRLPYPRDAAALPKEPAKDKGKEPAKDKESAKDKK